MRFQVFSQAALVLGLAASVVGQPTSTSMMPTTTPAPLHKCFDYVIDAASASGYTVNFDTQLPAFPYFNTTTGDLVVGTLTYNAHSLLPVGSSANGTGFVTPGPPPAVVECDERVTACLTVFVVNDLYPQGAIFPSCYSPNMSNIAALSSSPDPPYDYKWIAQAGIDCAYSKDGEIVWNPERTTAFSCCTGEGCNKVDEYTFVDFAPTCGKMASMKTMDCIAKYSKFGCSAALKEAGGFRLPVDDECFAALAPGTGCFADFCQECNCSMGMGGMGMPEMSPECKLMCDKIDDDFTSDGCHKDMIGNGMCDLFCMTMESFYDGGDCILDERFGTFIERGQDDFGDQLGDSIKDGPGSFNPAGKLEGGEGGAMKATERLIQEQVLLLFSILDEDFSQELDMEEMNINEHDFKMVEGDDDNDTIDAVELYRFFQNIVDTLSGKPVPDHVDMKSIIQTIVAIAARSKGDMPALSMNEASLLGIDDVAFDAIDDNDDDMINADEIWEMGKDIMEEGCNGFRHVYMKHGEFEFFATPIRAMHATCKILVMPEFFYKPMGFDDMAGEEPGPWGPQIRETDPISGSGSAVGSGRRLLNHDDNTTTPAPYVTPEELMEAKQWMVAVMDDRSRDVMCFGSLISPKAVLTAASCVYGMKADELFVRVGGAIPRSGKEMEIMTVSVYPGFEMVEHMVMGKPNLVAKNDIAVLVLKEPAEGLMPVKLYDGLDTGETDCKKLELAVGSWDGENASNVEDLMKVENDDCDKMFQERAGYSGIVREQMVCIKEMPEMEGSDMSRDTISMSGSMSGSGTTQEPVMFSPIFPGAPLLAKPAGGKAPWMVVGISMASGDMPALGKLEEDKQDVMLFTRTSPFLQWIYAHNVTMGGPLKPEMTLMMHIDDLELKDDAKLNVYTGPSVMGMPMMVEPCDVPAEAMSMNGALTLQAELPSLKAKYSIKAEFETSGCGMYDHMYEEEYKSKDEGTGSRRRLMSAQGSRRRLLDNHGGTADEHKDEMPPCVPCTLFHEEETSDDKWASVLELAKKGLAFTGGLGKKAVSTFEKEYGVWACAKNWGVEEQLACGVGKGDLHCFRYDEKSKMFDEYGSNEMVKLVKPEREMKADEMYFESLELF